MQTFDFVIIGAGSAGCCLANRLSIDKTKSVCLIEAGPNDNDIRIKIPIGLVSLMKHPRFNWLYTSTPQTQLKHQSIPIPRGKTLGGSSSINSMVYIRGRPSDYDRWSELGCTGWDWQAVLPYFKRSEQNMRLGSDPLHGDNGPLYVEDPPSPNFLCNVFTAAGVEIGIPSNNDFNGEIQEGLGTYQLNMHNGSRWSSADAFLKPVFKRPNLEVITNAEVKVINFNNKRAESITIKKGNNLEKINVHSEVILCAGSIGTPTILLQSGVGPAIQLHNLEINVIHDLPGVGENLHDHPAIPIHFSAPSVGYGVTFKTMPSILFSSLEYLLKRRGLLTSNTVEAGGFARTNKNISEPDIQFHFIPARVGHQGSSIVWGRGYYSDVCLLKPTSRGRLWLEKIDGEYQPQIDPNLLADIDDKHTLTDGFKILRQLLKAKPFRRYNPVEICPGDKIKTDKDITDYVLSHLGTAYHLVGTCRMGSANDHQTVVTPDLKIKGLENIRVADASIMPEIVAGNTNAPTIMIAEKASDLILDNRQ